jgi:hypothetical protein
VGENPAHKIDPALPYRQAGALIELAILAAARSGEAGGVWMRQQHMQS